MHQTLILEILEKQGQKLDRELIEDTGISLDHLRLAISELLATKTISACSVINHQNVRPAE